MSRPVVPTRTRRAPSSADVVSGDGPNHLMNDLINGSEDLRTYAHQTVEIDPPQGRSTPKTPQPRRRPRARKTGSAHSARSNHSSNSSTTECRVGIPPHSPDPSDTDPDTSTTTSIESVTGGPSPVFTAWQLQTRQRRQTSDLPPWQFIAIDPRPIRQLHLLSDFLHSYFPTMEAKAGMAARSSYLAALPDVDVSSLPMLRVAIDTLVLAHLGGRASDTRLIQASQDSYGKVLSHLIRATDSPKKGPSPRFILLSIMLLCLYDDAVPTQYRQQSGWVAHYWGCQQLLDVYGPSCFDLKEPLDRLIFANLRMPLYFVGITRRRRIAFARKDWIEFAEDPRAGPRLRGFYRIATALPGLLQQTDSLMGSHRRPDSLAAVCSTLENLRKDLYAWFATQLSTPEGKSAKEPLTISVDDADAFNMEVEEQCYIASSTTFPTVLRYRAPPMGFPDHTMMQITLLIVNCTLLRILHFKSHDAQSCMTRPKDDIEKEAFEAASILARSIFYFSGPPSLGLADFCWFLAEIALNFFGEVGAVRELGWCQAVQLATGLRIKRLKQKVQPRTLCRMGDLAADLAAVTRFQSRQLNPAGE